MVILDGEAMYFLLDRTRISEQNRPLPEIYLSAVFEDNGPGPVAVILGHAHYRDIQFHGCKDLSGRRNLTESAVHEDHIRQTDESTVTRQSPLVSSVYNLLKAAVIVWAFYGSYLESSVVPAYLFQPAEHYHGTYGIYTVGVGYII